MSSGDISVRGRTVAKSAIAAAMAGAILLLAACTSPEDARRALEAAGHTDIEITGYRFFGCGQEDLFRTGFEALGPRDARVTGVVCGGVFKGSTVRYD
jgi:hypothetical protein